MSDSGIVRGLSDDQMPICPNAMLRPGHLAHAVRVRMIDAAYEATKEYEDDGGELPEPLDKVHQALSDGPGADRMRLYFMRVSLYATGDVATVESWYFQCSICGLILPAQRKPAS